MAGFGRRGRGKGGARGTTRGFTGAGTGDDPRMLAQDGLYPPAYAGGVDAAAAAGAGGFLFGPGLGGQAPAMPVNPPQVPQGGKGGDGDGNPGGRGGAGGGGGGGDAAPAAGPVLNLPPTFVSYTESAAKIQSTGGTGFSGGVDEGVPLADHPIHWYGDVPASVFVGYPINRRDHPLGLHTDGKPNRVVLNAEHFVRIGGTEMYVPELDLSKDETFTELVLVAVGKLNFLEHHTTAPVMGPHGPLLAAPFVRLPGLQGAGRQATRLAVQWQAPRRNLAGGL